MWQLDDIDAKILEILQEDGRAPHSQIAERVGLSQPSVHERVKKLEQAGVIKGYSAIVDPLAVNLHVLAFIWVQFGAYKTSEVARMIEVIPEVQEVHHVAGEDCLLVKVRCHSPADLEPILDRIWSSGPVSGTRTTIVFSSHKESAAVPIDRRLLGLVEEEARSA